MLLSTSKQITNQPYIMNCICNTGTNDYCLGHYDCIKGSWHLPWSLGNFTVMDVRFVPLDGPSMYLNEKISLIYSAE